MADSTKKIISTTRYINAVASLTSSKYTLGDAIYITTAEMKATNKSADGISSIGSTGVIGNVREAPDLTNTASRLVIELTASDALNASLKILLQATEL